MQLVLNLVSDSLKYFLRDSQTEIILGKERLLFDLLIISSDLE